MLPFWMSTVASIGMAVGPPLVYADQAFSIVRKKDATGFSRDVCAILLVGNITRCFFWLGNRFEIALLIQSIFMILAQLALLYICIIYRPRSSPENLSSSRPLSFWQWSTYTQYIEFLAGLILSQAILFLIFGRSHTFIGILGFVALGLESTLPIPQLISNYRQRSLYGFRMSTLIGWVGGDSFKAVYFFLQQSPLQFKVCAIFQISIDIMIIGQRMVYGNAPPVSVLLQDELEQALSLADELPLPTIPLSSAIPPVVKKRPPRDSDIILISSDDENVPLDVPPSRHPWIPVPTVPSTKGQKRSLSHSPEIIVVLDSEDEKHTALKKPRMEQVKMQSNIRIKKICDDVK